jgi:hypothetical protein
MCLWDFSGAGVDEGSGYREKEHLTHGVLTKEVSHQQKRAVSVFVSLLSPYRFVSIHHPSHIDAPFGAYESGARRDT